MLRRDGRFCSEKVDYEIYVRRVQDRTLIEAEFRRRDPKTKKYDVWTWAQQAELHVDLAKHELKVTMHNCQVGGDGVGVRGFSGDVREWTVELPDLTQSPNRRPSQMRWFMLFEKEAEYRRQQEKIRHELDVLQKGGDPQDVLPSADASASPGQAKVTRQEAIDVIQARLKHLHYDLANIIAEYHLRPSLALGCLCFVLVGCPIGIWFSKSDYLSAFITCFMPIVVMYYPLLLCGINMGKSGSVYPGATIWIANILMSITALFLFRKLVKN